MDKQELLNIFTKEEILGLYLNVVNKYAFDIGNSPVENVTVEQARIYFDCAKVGNPKYEMDILKDHINFEVLNSKELCEIEEI